METLRKPSEEVIAAAVCQAWANSSGALSPSALCGSDLPAGGGGRGTTRAGAIADEADAGNGRSGQPTPSTNRLGFPEFTRYLSDLNTELASAILRQYPTAQAFRALSPKRLAKLTYDGRHRVGEDSRAS